MRYWATIFFITIFVFVKAQESEYLFYGGSIFGGPLPKENIEKTTGKPLISPYGGFAFRKYLHQNLFIQLDITYAIKGASYYTEYTNDTLIDIGIGIVPSFYTAKVGGNMKLHYIDLPISFGYRISKKQSISFGIYTSLLFNGYDKGKIFVQAGYGSFADQEIAYNNYSLINHQDFGLNFKYNFNFYKNFHLTFNASRSTRGLYSNNISNNLYHTNASLSFCYSLQ